MKTVENHIISSDSSDYLEGGSSIVHSASYYIIVLCFERSFVLSTSAMSEATLPMETTVLRYSETLGDLRPKCSLDPGILRYQHQQTNLLTWRDENDEMNSDIHKRRSWKKILDMSPSKLSRMTLFLPSQLLADAGTRCVLHHPCSNSVQGTHHTLRRSKIFLWLCPRRWRYGH